MLNTYRIISLSLVMALFFAAPLLCIHPISCRIKKSQEIAANNGQGKKVSVVVKRARHYPQIKSRSVSAAWARPIHRTLLEPSDREADVLQSPPPSTWDQGESWHGDYQSDWDAGGEDADMGTVTTVGHTPL